MHLSTSVLFDPEKNWFLTHGSGVLLQVPFLYYSCMTISYKVFRLFLSMLTRGIAWILWCSSCRQSIYLFIYLFVIGVAGLLCRCDVNLLLSSLCTRSIQTREGTIIKALDCNAAVASRDALAKTVYSRLFDWYGFSCSVSLQNSM